MKILQGIFNWLFPGRREKLAQERLAICNTCSLKVVHVGVSNCLACGCFLQWKSRSSEECDYNYWKKGEVDEKHRIIDPTKDEWQRNETN